MWQSSQASNALANQIACCRSISWAWKVIFNIVSPRQCCDNSWLCFFVNGVNLFPSTIVWAKKIIFHSSKSHLLLFQIMVNEFNLLLLHYGTTDAPSLIYFLCMQPLEPIFILYRVFSFSRPLVIIDPRLWVIGSLFCFDQDQSSFK